MTVAGVLHQGAGSTLDFFLRAEFERRGWQAMEFDTRRRPDRAIGERLLDCQIVVLVRYLPRSWIPILRRAQQAGKRIVYMMDDDLFDSSCFRGLPSRYARKLRRLAWSQRQRILSFCSEFWVSSAELAQRYASHHPRVLPLEPISRVIAPAKAFRVAYHGTGSHLEEIRWLLPLVQQLQRICTTSQVQIYGGRPVHRLFADVPRVEVLQPVPWDRYLEQTALDPQHLLLCPLRPTPFNGARAAVKFFDAARLGALGLYSNRPPYSSFVRDGEDGLLLGDDRDSWLDAILDLQARPEVARAMATAGRERARALCH